MTLTIKDSPEVTGTSKSGLSGKSSDNPQGQSSRSDPVCLEVPVVVRSLPGEGGNAPGAAGPTRQEGRSVIVFDNGGVLRLGNSLPVGQKVILTNQQGRDVVGRVVGGRNLPSIKGYIEVEFIEPVSDFWQIHKSSEANRVSSPAPLDLSDATQLLPSTAEPRLAPPPPRPIAPARAQNIASGSAPTFEDVAGLVQMSPPAEPLDRKNEPPVRSPSAPAKDPLAQGPVQSVGTGISSTNIPVSSISESVAGKPAESPAPTTFSALTRKLPSPNDATGKVATFSGMSSLPTPDESSGRMPLMLGGAALLLVALGGGYFLMHRGLSPNSAPPAAVAASQPAAPLSQPSGESASAPISGTAVEQAPPQTSQTVAANAPAPAEVAAPEPAASQNVRQRANPVETKQPDRTAARRPQVSNLKMSSPISPGKNLANVPDGSSAASVDMTLTSVPGAASPGTFGARTDHQPAPPSDALVENSAPHAAKVVQSAKLISSTRPVYPVLAKQSNTQGRVSINLSIDETGNVVAAKAVSGPPPLRQAAVDSVKQWKYSPALIDGKPSSSQLTIDIDFRLN